MAYAPTRDVDAASVLRLGLRARLRAAREARMASARARTAPAHPGDLRAAALRACSTLDGHGPRR